MLHHKTNGVAAKLKKWGCSSLSTLLFFAVWYALSAAGILNAGIIPGPEKVIARLFTNLFATDQFALHVLPTIRRAALGFAMALGIGLAVAFLLESVLRFLRPVVIPIMHFLEKLNPIALFPVFMLFWGIGELSKVLIIFWVVVWLIAFHTIDGIENVNPVFIQSAKSMGARRATLLFKVYLPAAGPDIFLGIRLGANIAFIFVISVEMLSASAGLGWFVQHAKHQYNLPNLYSCVILVAIIGLLVSALMNRIERRAFAWKQDAIQQ